MHRRSCGLAKQDATPGKDTPGGEDQGTGPAGAQVGTHRQRWGLAPGGAEGSGPLLGLSRNGWAAAVRAVLVPLLPMRDY